MSKSGGNNLTATQRDKVEQVMAFTSCSARQAQETLAALAWNVEAAADMIFDEGVDHEALRGRSNAPSSTSTAIDPKINQLFDHYAAMDEQDGEEESAGAEMKVNGIVQFLDDIGVDDPEGDVIVLVLALKMQAKEMLRYTREEFARGMRALQCNTSEQLRQALPMLRHQFETNESLFWEVYLFAYHYGLAPGQKVLTKDVALALWKMLLTPTRFALMPDFLDFFQRTQKHGVNKDMWQQVSALVKLYNEQAKQSRALFLQEFDKISSWPIVLDEFVDYLKSSSPPPQ